MQVHTLTHLFRCGGKTWPAGEVLANYMIRKYKNTEDLKGKKIIELGSGTGYFKSVISCWLTIRLVGYSSNEYFGY